MALAKLKLAVVNQKRCVSCGACVKACPRFAMSIYKGCYAQANKELCVGCGICANTCPASCISIEKRD